MAMLTCPSLRYAQAEARSPRPGGQGVLAKLAEVLFIEVLRICMNEQAVGRTGWLAGVNDRIVGATLRALHAEPAPPSTARSAASTGCHRLRGGAVKPALRRSWPLDLHSLSSRSIAESDTDAEEARTLRPLQAGAVTYRIAFGPRAGRKVPTLRGAMPHEAAARQQ